MVFLNQNYQYLYTDFEDLNSIKSAEKHKSQLENKGFNLIKTEQTGFNKFKTTYKKGD